MGFKPFKMAQHSAQWPPGSLQNMHSSNPQPWRLDELGELIQTDLSSILSNTPLAYEPVQGNTSVRNLLCENYHNGLNANNLVLTSGAQEGIFLVMNALLHPRDHVITFSPCFEPLVQVAKDTGADVSVLPLDEAQGWKINWDLLESSFKDSTKLLVINFPHNPTGSHITEDELNQLIKLCEQHNCWLFSDEVFRGLEHTPTARISSAADLYERAISMGVVSKALALPGIRVGWLSCQNKKLMTDVINIKSYLSICQSSLDAQLCATIIPHSERLWERSLGIIKSNKKCLTDILQDNHHYDWYEPTASATAFIRNNEHDILKLCHQWADKYKVMLMPNHVFLTEHPGFRLTLGMLDAQPIYERIFKPL